MNQTESNVSSPAPGPLEHIGLLPVLAALPGGTAGAGHRCKDGKAAWVDSTASWDCINTYVIDAQVYASMITSAAVGALCLGAFCWLQSIVSVYRSRTLCPQVAVKPPVSRHKGILKYFYWIWVTITLSEKELLATAGMDALMFERLIVFCLQLFAPLTVLSLSILVPIHASSHYLGVSLTSNEVTATLMGLTMSSVAEGSPVLWVHFGLVCTYVLYAMWLLDGHYKWYVLLRQHYLTMGDSASPWLGHAVVPRHSLSLDPRMRSASLDPTCTFDGDDDGGGGGDGGGAASMGGWGAAAAKGAELGGGAQACTAPCEQVVIEMADRRQEQPVQGQQQQQQQQQRTPWSDDGRGRRATDTSDAAPSSLPSRQASTRGLLAGGAAADSASEAFYSAAAAAVDGGDGAVRDYSDGGQVPVGLACASSPRRQELHTLSLPGFLRQAASGVFSSSGGGGGAGSVAGSGRRKAHRAARGSSPDGRRGAGGAGGSPNGRAGGSVLARLGGPSDAGDDDAEDAAWRASKVQAARAAAAAEASGADREWWEFKVGDPLLDRHITRLDLEDDLAWRHAEPGIPHTPGGARLQHWWEVAPKEATDAPRDIEPVPGTRLVFDHRSLRTRKMSVRFRNTINAVAPNGRAVPLHVSNYAVLVTDVPDLLAGDDGDDGDHSGCLCSLGHCLVWYWPCLLSAEDMEALSRRWSKARTRHEIRNLARPDGVPAAAAGVPASGADKAAAAPKAAGKAAGPGGGGAARAPRRGPGADAAADAARRAEAALAGASRLRLVERTFSQLFPDDYSATVPVVDHRGVVELLRTWDKDLKEYIQGRALLQRKLARRRAAGRASPAAGRASPAGGSGGGDGGSSASSDEEDGGGCCANRGLPCWRPVMPRAEALDNQRQALLALEAKIIAAQKEALAGPPTGSFIVLFKTPQAATLAASSSVFPTQNVHSGGVAGGRGDGARMGLDAFKVQQAPGPEDVLWESLWKPWSERRAALVSSLPCYAFLLLFPTGFFSATANNVMFFICRPDGANGGPAPYAAWFCDTKLLQFVATVVLPFVGLMLWQNMVIPQNLYRLELQRGAAVSLSQMERNMLGLYFGWEVINLFLGAVLSSSLLTQVQVLLDNPESWPAVLGRSFPNSSNFFLNYVIMRAFLMNLFRLIMPHGGMWRWVGQMLFTGCTGVGHAATERYRAFIEYPASIRYGREPGLVLLILLIGVAFSVVAPLMTPFALAYMATSYLVWRYQIIYVCVRCYESGGRLWTLYFKIINWCLAMFIVFTGCMFLLKKANVQAVLSLCLLPAVFFFSRRCSMRFDAAVESMPLWLAHAAPRTTVDPQVYTAPALRPGARGWFFESGKAWVRWGVPMYARADRAARRDQ